jgi:hypothetical protein
MDIRTLKVGQYVVMGSGVYGDTGMVVKVTPDGVEVEITERTPTLESLMSWQAGKIATRDIQTTDKVKVLHFDAEGKGCDGEGTFECGPWELLENQDHWLLKDRGHAGWCAGCQKPRMCNDKGLCHECVERHAGRGES